MRILVVRLRLIGDVVFTTPLVRALRLRYPDAHLTYLVESAAAPVLETNSHMSELLVIPHTRGLARVRDDLRLARRLRRARFDLVIDCHGGPRSAWLTWATGAPRRIGYDIGVEANGHHLATTALLVALFELLALLLAGEG